ncbi:hypothetical protein AK830_g9356 [Neonectria ditissima]|uniref:Uncharacterized protein n=1 Tax=Neonectria ditissima TaxID=78410 RepID=A0A0P7B9P8_9HYPO|nr:hypothetical protein AK830_g9356 [Neonectria ditissima]
MLVGSRDDKSPRGSSMAMMDYGIVAVEARIGPVLPVPSFPSFPGIDLLAPVLRTCSHAATSMEMLPCRPPPCAANNNTPCCPASPFTKAPEPSPTGPSDASVNRSQSAPHFHLLRRLPDLRGPDRVRARAPPSLSVQARKSPELSRYYRALDVGTSLTTYITSQSQLLRVRCTPATVLAAE